MEHASDARRSGFDDPSQKVSDYSVNDQALFALSAVVGVIVECTRIQRKGSETLRSCRRAWLGMDRLVSQNGSQSERNYMRICYEINLV